MAKATRILCAAIIITIISFIINTVGAYADMNHYTNPDYFPVWSKLMMPGPGPPPVEFTYYSIAFGFVTALLFTFIFSKVRPIFSGKSYIKAGLLYGFGVFLIAGVPSALSLLLLINLPLLLILSWTAQSLVAYLISGVVAARLVK